MEVLPKLMPNISKLSSPPPIRDAAAYAEAVADRTPSRRPTQASRVLRVLRERGATGLLSTEFMLSPPDGGPRIVSTPGRILQLKRAGWLISTTIETPSGLARYVLEGRAVPTACSPSFAGSAQ
jgi:hypothetical protein